VSAVTDVIWHDVECGSYRADLPLWRELAARHGGPILDVGAGTGRVTLDLAGHGHRVTALDRDTGLIDELTRRAGDLPVRAVCADARDFDLAERFSLILVPMQTLQLLDLPDRSAFLRRAAAHLAPNARLAAALADPFDGFDSAHDEPPPPDLASRDGITYASQPVAVRRDGDAVVIERIRRTLSPGQTAAAALDTVRLAELDAEQLAAEAAAVGLRPAGRHRVPETGEHVGSTVVVLCA
jgi:SAM-dependent methyltransferase